MENRTSDINIQVTLDEKNIPEKIIWDATDATNPGWKESRAMLLSFWDPNSKPNGNGISIELWTKDMTIDDMNIFFFQTLMQLGDTFERATMNAESAQDMKEFAKTFLDKVSKMQASKK